MSYPRVADELMDLCIPISFKQPPSSHGTEMVRDIKVTTQEEMLRELGLSSLVKRLMDGLAYLSGSRECTNGQQPQDIVEDV